MYKTLRILMLEDVDDDARLISNILLKADLSFTSIRVDTRLEFTAALDSFQPTVILSDHSLPQFNSLEALEICRQRKLDIPFLLVTGAVSEEFAVSCIKKGADDYVLKTNLARLPLAIKHAIRQRRFEHSRRALEVTLRSQNKELRKLNRELDLFVYSASHNLRAPLRSVLGLITLSKHELAHDRPEALHEYFAMMENSIAKLDDTLRHILDYSKSSHLEEDVEEIDFNKVFDEIFAGLEYINGPKRILKLISIHAGPSLYCSRLRLNIILLNLISNAIKYYDPAKEQSFLKLEVMPTDGMVTIVIEDNGIGIAEDAQARVFDMFYRATEKADGSGLGLYIVKETLERLGGSIILLSTPGAGTTFTVTIPNESHHLTQETSNTSKIV